MVSFLSLMISAFCVCSRADIIWFEDTENADLRGNWTQNGDVVELQNFECSMTPTGNCWELQAASASIYRIASTKGFTNISFTYDIHAISGDCRILYNTVNNNSAWIELAFYSDDPYCSNCVDIAVHKKRMLDPATFDRDYVGIKIQVEGNSATDQCLLSDLSLQGDPLATTSPTSEPTVSPTSSTSNPSNAPTSVPTELPSAPSSDPTSTPTEAPTELPTISLEPLVDLVINLNIPTDQTIDNVVNVIITTCNEYLLPIFGDYEYNLNVEVIENEDGKAKIGVIVTSPNEEIEVDEEELKETIEEALIHQFGSSIIDSEGEASETTSSGDTPAPKQADDTAPKNLTVLYVLIAVLLGLLLIGFIVFYVQRRRKQSPIADAEKVEPGSPRSVEMQSTNDSAHRLQSASASSLHDNEDEDYKIDIVEPAPNGSYVAATNGLMNANQPRTNMGTSFISNAHSDPAEGNENSEEDEVLYAKDEDDGKKMTTRGMVDDEVGGATPRTPGIQSPLGGGTADGENDAALDYIMDNVDNQNGNENEQDEGDNDDDDDDEEDHEQLYDAKNRKKKTTRGDRNGDDEEDMYVKPAETEATKGDTTGN